jgi:CRISPR-associated endonuclease Csn1
MKKILGLDIGTNSIGAALININEFGKSGNIEWIGSRIIPLDGDSLSKFENGGQVETKAANRRMLRGARRLKQRYKLRRSRLIKVFKILEWVNEDFPENFKEANKQKGGAFNINTYFPISENSQKEAYQAFGTDKISEDWIVYFLRKKALEQEITLQELARILYMLNQRRGFKSSRKEIKAEEENVDEKWPKIKKWIEILKVSEITELCKSSA